MWYICMHQNVDCTCLHCVVLYTTFIIRCNIQAKENAPPDNVVEASCFIVNIGWTDCEQICSRINNNWCRSFAFVNCIYYTKLLHAVDKALHDQNVLQSVVIDFASYLLTISLPAAPLDAFCIQWQILTRFTCVMVIIWLHSLAYCD